METPYTDKAAKSESCKARGPSCTVINLTVCGLTEGSGWIYICRWIVFETQLLA